MPHNEYRIATTWRVPGTPDEVYEVLIDIKRCATWCPEVYRSANVVDAGKPDGAGRTADLVTGGSLPVKLHWRATIVETRQPEEFTIHAHGEIVGRCKLKLRPSAEESIIAIDWILRIEKPWMRIMSSVLHPLFQLHFTWGLARGQEGLIREMGRRRLKSRRSADV
jgi:hypothetical protein